MKNFMSKHSLCAHIAIQLDMVRCSASIYEACYILSHAEMKRGGIKTLEEKSESIKLVITLVAAKGRGCAPTCSLSDL